MDLGEGGGITVQMAGPYGGSAGSSKITEIAMTAARWKGAESPYSMIVTVEGVSQRSKVDLWPTKEQWDILETIGTGLCAVNEDGVITVYAIGNKPTDDMTIQATITEVTA